MLLTEHDDREIFTAAIELGAYFVPKPFRAKDLQTFAARALVAAAGHSAIDLAIARCQQHGLTLAEVEVLRLAVAGHERSVICRLRNVTEGTLQTQIHGLCKKTGQHALEAVVSRVLRDAFVILSTQVPQQSMGRSRRRMLFWLS